MRQILATKPKAFVMFLCALAVGSGGNAAANMMPPGPFEAPATGKRVATRALQRSTSTDWPTDVAERLRLLEDHAERAARDQRARKNEEAGR